MSKFSNTKECFNFLAKKATKHPVLVIYSNYKEMQVIYNVEQLEVMTAMLLDACMQDEILATIFSMVTASLCIDSEFKNQFDDMVKAGVNTMNAESN